MKKRKEETKWEDMANESEIGNSIDNMKENANEQEQEPPSKVRRLESNEEERDECLQHPLKLARLDNVLKAKDLDADFGNGLILGIHQGLEPTASQKPYRKSKHQELPISDPPPKLTTLNDYQPSPRRTTRYEEDLGLQKSSSPTAPPLQPFPYQKHRTPTRSLPPRRYAPPLNTQTIFNFDEFPSFSQQAHELKELEDDPLILAPPVPEIEEEESDEEKDEAEAAELRPSTPPDSSADSPSSSPRPIFTPSGFQARMALGRHYSRRTAALEEMRRRYCPYSMEEATAQPPEACKALSNGNQLKPSLSPNPSLHDEGDNHLSSPSQELAGPGASQESYGGAWLDELPPGLLV